MDQELIAYLDERFRETSRQIQDAREASTQQISSLREEVTQQVSSLREEVTQQVSSLREEATQQTSSLREELTQQISSLREEVIQRVERVENTSHETQIMVEHLHGEIRLVAEGVAAVDEKLRTSVTELKREIKEVQSLFTVHNKKLDSRVQVVEERTARHTREIAALRRRSDKTRPRPS